MNNKLISNLITETLYKEINSAIETINNTVGEHGFIYGCILLFFDLVHSYNLNLFFVLQRVQKNPFFLDEIEPNFGVLVSPSLSNEIFI